MSLITPEVEALLYLFAAVAFILALKGLSSPKSARRGNIIGAVGALVGVVTVFIAEELKNVGWILLVIGIGTIISIPASRMVKMTQMPSLLPCSTVWEVEQPELWHCWNSLLLTPLDSCLPSRSPFSWVAFRSPVQSSPS